MNFDLNENQQMIAKMVQDFGKKSIKPHVLEWDEKQEFPIPLFKNWENWD